MRGEGGTGPVGLTQSSGAMHTVLLHCKHHGMSLSWQETGAIDKGLGKLEAGRLVIRLRLPSR